MPFPFLALIITTVTTLLGELLRPRPQDPAAKQLKDFDFPTSQEARPVPVAFGQVVLDAPNILWWGDFSSDKIRQCRSIFLGIGKMCQTIGYKYRIGIVFGLCHGPVDFLHAIRINKHGEFYTVGGIDLPFPSAGDYDYGTTSYRMTFDSPEILGGQEHGRGGVYANLVWYIGNWTQGPNSYLSTVPKGPRFYETPEVYRGVSYLVWEGPTSSTSFSGWVGNDTVAPPLEFVLIRIPKYLTSTLNVHLTGFQAAANPVDIIYELLTNYDYGAGLPGTIIDETSFLDAMWTIGVDELMGVSFIWDRAEPIQTLVEEMLRVIDGVLYTDLRTGKIVLKLVRDDYDIMTIPAFDEIYVTELVSFSRGAWDETINEVKVSYTEATAVNYEGEQVPLLVQAQDMVNVRIQGQVNSYTSDYLGISDYFTAARLANRDLKLLSTPLAKVTLRVTREAFDLLPGDVFLWSWTPLGIQDMVLRVVKISYGQLESGIIELECAEDIFAANQSVFFAAGPGFSFWEPPDTDPALLAPYETSGVNQGEPADLLLEETPYWFTKDSVAQAYLVASRADNISDSWDVFYSPVGDDFFINAPTPAVDRAPFTPRAEVSTLISATATTLTLTNGKSLGVLEEDPVGDLGLAYFQSTGEWIRYTNFNASTNILTIERGVLGTLPCPHKSGERLWFVGAENNFFGDPLAEGDRPGGAGKAYLGETASARSDQLWRYVNRMAFRPYPPDQLTINGSQTSTTIPDTGTITIGWRKRSRLIDSFSGAGDLEAGTTYTLRIYGDQNRLMRIVTGLTGTSTTYTNVNETADRTAAGLTTGGIGGLNLRLRFELEAIRDSYRSHHYWAREAKRTGGADSKSESGFTWTTGTNAASGDTKLRQYRRNGLYKEHATFGGFPEDYAASLLYMSNDGINTTGEYMSVTWDVPERHTTNSDIMADCGLGTAFTTSNPIYGLEIHGDFTYKLSYTESSYRYTGTWARGDVITWIYNATTSQIEVYQSDGTAGTLVYTYPVSENPVSMPLQFLARIAYTDVVIREVSWGTA